MAEHTPAPWQMSQKYQEGVFTIRMGSFSCHGLIGIANARLIAAAPELLAALEAFLDAMAMGPLELAAQYGPDAHPDEALVDAAYKARSAIAKASGARLVHGSARSSGSSNQQTEAQMSEIIVTACTTMGHLLQMTHHPNTLESAHRWARELVSLPGIRHVNISETNTISLHTMFAGDNNQTNGGTDD